MVAKLVEDKNKYKAKNIDNSRFKSLWDKVHKQLEKKGSTIVKYFTVHPDVLMPLIKSNIESDLKRYMDNLMELATEDYIVFPKDGYAFFKKEQRLVPLKKDSDEILYFGSDCNLSTDLEGNYTITYSGESKTDISKSVCDYLKSKDINLVDGSYNTIFRKINIQAALNFYNKYNLKIPLSIINLKNSKVLSYSDMYHTSYYDEVFKCYPGKYSTITSSTPFAVIFSKKITETSESTNFIKYILTNFSEPKHPTLEGFSIDFYSKLANILKQHNQIERVVTIYDLFDSTYNFIIEEFDALKSYDDFCNYFGADFNKVLYKYYKEYLKKCDEIRANIYPYKTELFEDVNKGHWEVFESFYNELDSNAWIINVPDNEILVARDPLCDVNNTAVCGIDFGTKSTVVVCRDPSEILLRIGGGDLLRNPNVKDYENPTTISLEDYKSFIQDYQRNLGRPFTKYKDLMVSHDASKKIYQESFDKQKYYSVFSELKQWANSKDRKQLLQDTKGYNIELKPYLLLKENDFDPIEIYAYYLGLYINNMHRGIYMKYMLSFPVNYKKAIRDKILQSFERGIKKSLPTSVLNNIETMKRFKITSGASEPAAYAISALKEYGLEPKEEELKSIVSYGVFDFGGGTTDFDFGIEYIPNNKSYKFEIEQLGNGGDAYLGGENLLNMLAFEVYKSNIKLMRDNEISIVMPPKCQRFPGSEVLVQDEKDGNQISYLNLKLIAHTLRALWEEVPNYESYYTEGQKALTLYTANGDDVIVKIKIDIKALKSVIETQINDGVENFMSCYYKIYNEYNEKLTRPLHILLAGNSCKSSILQKVFITRIIKELNNMKDKLGDEKDISEIFRLYPPLGSQFNIENIEEIDNFKRLNIDIRDLLYIEDKEK